MKHVFALATVVAAVVLAGVAACGGEERLSREEFSARLQNVDERGSELYGRLAEGAQDLEPDEPLPADVKEALRELAEFQDEAAADLETLNPPEDAEEAVELLVEALRQRTNTFEQVIEAGRFTAQDFQRVMQSGEQIDQAFEQLRAEGFVATSDEHEDE